MMMMMMMMILFLFNMSFLIKQGYFNDMINPFHKILQSFLNNNNNNILLV